MKVDEAWTLRVSDLSPAPNLIEPRVIRHVEPRTGALVDTLAVLLATKATAGRVAFLTVGLPPIALRAVPQPRGGLRWLFVDPDADRLVSTLIRPHGAPRFASREAWGPVSYASQRTSPRRRAEARARNIRLALGGPADLGADFPERPRGMWPTTYDRLRAEAEAATTTAITGRRLPTRCNQDFAR